MTTDLGDDDAASSVSDDPAAGRDSLMVIAIVVAALALVGSVIAIGTSWSGTPEGTETDGGQAMVSLSEFAISPASVGTGGSLHVMNEGSVAHNVVIEGSPSASTTSPPSQPLSSTGGGGQWPRSAGQSRCGRGGTPRVVSSRRRL